MNITTATNWDPEFIEQLEMFPQVTEVFGVLQKTPVGSGRPYFIVANPDKKEAARYIEKVRRGGRKFNYLLNGACMNNMEYDKKTHHELLDHIRWLLDTGVDSVTVTIPYLLEIVKQQFPDLKVRVSLIAHVNSVQRAKFFENLGADAINLDFNINRDFKLLEKIGKAVKCKLSLIVNDGCLYQCPYRYYHYNLLAHSTQPHNALEGFYVDYCIVRCTLEKYAHPTEIMKSRWIRPEDLHHYEEIGIDTFKISGRRMSSRWLLNVVNAYSERKYDGNLLDLLNCVTPGVDPDIRSPQYNTFLEKTEFFKREKLIELGQLYPVKPYIDNSELDGFIEFFKKCDCLSLCDDCDYCERMADRAITIDPQEAGRYTSALEGLLGDLTSSRFFEDPEPAKQEAGDNGVTWNLEVEKTFEHLILGVPETFRDIARKTVKRKAESNAGERHSPLVEEADMVLAFLSETPEAFKDQMIPALEETGIRVSDYC